MNNKFLLDSFRELIGSDTFSMGSHKINGINHELDDD